jgi:hypothetical protein
VGGCVIRQEFCRANYTLNDELLRRNLGDGGKGGNPGGENQLSPVSAYVYEDLVAANFDWVAGQGNSGVRQQLAVGYVKLPSMPWAGHDLPVQLTFAQGPTAVQAHVIDSKELAFHIRQRDSFAFDLEFPNRPGEHLKRCRRSHKSHPFS